MIYTSKPPKSARRAREVWDTAVAAYGDIRGIWYPLTGHGAPAWGVDLPGGYGFIDSPGLEAGPWIPWEIGSFPGC